MTLPPVVRLLRPHQYSKNLLLFAAPGAARLLDETSVLWSAFVGFVLFCAVSSSGYVANDVQDVEADRLHPTKKLRPIASGEVSESTARALLLALLIAPLVIASLALPGWFQLTLVGYAALTFVYSFSLKRVPWLELVAVSAGFLLRAVAGGAATDTPLSSWFLTVVSGGALMVIAGKRLGELLTLGSDSPSRPVLGHYSGSSLKAFSGVAAAVAATGYVGWALTQGDGMVEPLLAATAIPFFVAIGRYLQLSWRGDGEAPDLLVFQDPVVLISGLAWVVLYALGLYT